MKTCSKFFQKITSLLLAFAMVSGAIPAIGSTPTAFADPATDTSGYVDRADGEHIGGWAKDETYPGFLKNHEKYKAVDVKIYDKDVLVQNYTKTANENRDPEDKIITGDHAFGIATQTVPTLNTAGEHVITVKAIDVDTGELVDLPLSDSNLSNTFTNAQCGSANGKTLTEEPKDNFCTFGKNPTSVQFLDEQWRWTCKGINNGKDDTTCFANKGTANSNLPTGYVDRANGEHIGGWAQDMDYPAMRKDEARYKAVDVRIYDKGVLVQNYTKTANDSRDYVGDHAFGIATQTVPTLNTVGKHTITVKAKDIDSNTWVPLTFSHPELSNEFINAECGSANGGSFSTTPATTTLCNFGNATAVSSSGGQWRWTCEGTNSGTNATCSANMLTAPAVPTNLKATNITKNALTLTWNDKATNESGYRVYQNNVQIYEGTSPDLSTFNVIGLTPNTTYTFKVSAYNTNSEAFSSPISATTLNPNPTAPAAPTGLATSNITKTSITLSWNDNATNEDGYRIYQNGTLINTLVANPTNPQSFNVTGLTPSTSYNFRVAAYNTGGEGSASITETTLSQTLAPAAPTGLVASSITQTSITLSWTDNADNEDGYRVYQNNVQIYEGTSPDLSTFNVIGLTPNTTYTFRVAAYNPTGEGSAQISATTLNTMPLAPTGLAVFNITQTSLTLSWIDNATNETGYKIYQNGVLINTLVTNPTNPQSFNVTGLTPNTAYAFRVAAYNTGGEASSQISATTLNSTPAAPTGLAASNITQTSLTLTWNDNATNETGYRIYLDGNPTPVATIAANLETVNITGLTAGTAYTFGVAAYNTGGEGSSQISATTSSSNSEAPTPPTGLVASSITQTTLTLSWDDNATNETGYRVYQNNALIGTLLANTELFNVTGLSANTTYTFRVTAYNAGGEGSSQIFATTLSTGPATPTNLTVSNITQTSLSLSWTDNATNETGYRIYQDNSLIGNLATNSTSFNVNGLTPNTTYTFRVAAYNTGGESSAQISATTLSPAPAAPTGLAASNITQTSLTLSWTDNATNETGYRVYQDNSLVGTLAANSSSFGVTGLSPNTTYTLRVTAYNAGGEGSSQISVTTLPSTPPPLAPTITQISVTHNSASVFWIDNATNEDEYIISYYATSGGGITTISGISANTTQYTMYGLLPNTEYRFTVIAYNNSGQDDDSVTATTLSVPPSSSPEAPTELNAFVTDTTVTLSWTDNADNEDGYRVYQNGNLINTIQANSNGYFIGGLTRNTLYTFRVAAYNTIGEGSSQLSVTTLSNPIPNLPAFPSNLVVSNITQNSLTLSWTDNATNEDGYRVYQNGVLINTLIANSQSFNVTGLSPNTTYTFRVAAYNIVGEASAQVSATTSSATNPPPAPTITQTSATHNSISIFWVDNATNEDNYRISYFAASGGETTTISGLPANSTRYTVSGLFANTGYQFTVTAYNNSGQNGANVTDTTLSTPNSGSPTAPTELYAFVTNTTSTLSWIDNATNETGYRVYQRIGSQDEVLLNTIPANSTGYFVGGLTPNTQYTFRVAAYNNSGEGRSEVTVTTLSNPIDNLPLAPTNLTVSNLAETSLTLNWTDNATNESGYRIYQNGVLINNTLTGNSQSFNVTGLAPNTTYFFRVAAYNSYGEASAQTFATTLSTNSPAAPTNLQASATHHNATITWTDNADNEQGYRVYKQTGSQDPILISTLPANTTQNTTNDDLIAGTTYTFTIVAYNSNGEGSAQISVTTLSTPPNSAPLAPTELVAYVTDTTVALYWTNNANNADGYRIYQNGNIITTIAPNSTGYFIGGLTPSTQYNFRVAAYNTAGEGSSHITLTTLPSYPSGLPATPTNLQASATHNSVYLHWNDNANNELGYRIYQNGALITTTPLPSDSFDYTIEGLNEETVYIFRVAAFNTIGEASAQTSVTTLNTPSDITLYPPTGLYASSISTNSISLRWIDHNNGTNETNEDSYRIYQTGVDTPFFLNANSTQYSISNLASGTEYTFRVAARRGNDEAMSIITISTLQDSTVPVAPTITQASVTNNSTSIFWNDNANNEAGYRIYRGSINSTPVAIIPANSTSYTVPGLTENTTYTFIVVAYNNVGQNSDDVTVTTLLNPPIGSPNAPTELYAFVTSTTSTLSWTDNATNENGYKIYQDTVEIANIPANSVGYFIGGLTPNTQYTFRVAAYNTNGEGRSQTTVTTLSTPNPNLPAFPSNLVVSNITQNSLSLNWNDNATNETGYRVYQNGRLINTLATNPTNPQSFNVTGLSPNTTYIFRVAAYNPVGEASAQTSATTLVSTNNPPVAPTGLNATSTTNSITLIWIDNANNEDNYIILRDNVIMATLPANSNTHTVNGLNPSTAYRFTVIARNSYGDGSAQIDAITAGGGSGGGGGGGGGRLQECSNTTTPYPLPASESSTLYKLIRPLDLKNTDGIINRPVFLENCNQKHNVSFTKGTEVKVCSTETPFKGILYPPKTVSLAQFEHASKVPNEVQVLRIVEFTANDNREICFTPDLESTIRFQFPEGVVDSALKLYRYNSLKDSVDFVTDKLDVDKENMEVIAKVNRTGIYILTHDKKVARDDDNTFVDIKGHWAEEYIRDLAEQGVLAKLKYFRPNDTALRAEVAKVVIEAFNLVNKKDIKKTFFPDVFTSDWFAPYVVRNMELGVVQGYPDSYFRPGKQIVRAEALKVVLLAAGLEYFTGPNPFYDVPAKEWFASYVGFSHVNGIVKGVSPEKFEPARQVTRAELAAMIVRTQRYLISMDDDSFIAKVETPKIITKANIDEEALFSAKIYNGKGEVVEILNSPVWCQYSLDNVNWITYGDVAYTDDKGEARCKIKVNKPVDLYVRGFRKGLTSNRLSSVKVAFEE